MKDELKNIIFLHPSSFILHPLLYGRRYLADAARQQARFC